MSSTKYISLATWVDKQNIHELVFQLNYKQNIFNWVDKQNIHELVSQFSYKQIEVDGVGEWEWEVVEREIKLLGFAR